MSRWCEALQTHYETKIDPDWIDVRKVRPPRDTMIETFWIENAPGFSVMTKVGYLKPKESLVGLTHWKHLSSPPIEELLQHRDLLLEKGITWTR